jgi:UDP-2,3-diacylglucosamine pyrophosphatase LpxH
MLGVEIHDRIVHKAADGRRYLVVHGDETDLFDARFPKLSRLSTRLDSGMRGLVGWINTRRQRKGLPKSNLAERVVKRFNDIVRACDAFEERLSDVARKHKADGIICGHFHKPALHADHGVQYANCGDWVENATALVETANGRLLLIDWEAHGVQTSAASRLPLEMTASPVHMGFAQAAHP